VAAAKSFDRIIYPSGDGRKPIQSVPGRGPHLRAGKLSCW
jgi:hypothetical protein